MTTPPRSWLLVPGDQPDQLDAAFATGAGAVVVDLYSAIPDAAKKDARVAADEWLGGSNAVRAAEGAPATWVRINEAEVGEDDVQMVLGHKGIAGIWMPSVSLPQPVEDIISIIGRKPLELGMIFDSARGLLNSHLFTSLEKVRYLSLDDATLVSELGLDPSDDERELLSLRGHLTIVASAFGKVAPVAAAWLGERPGREVGVAGEGGPFAVNTDQVRRGGHSGRFTTRPDAVDIIEGIFSK